MKKTEKIPFQYSFTYKSDRSKGKCKMADYLNYHKKRGNNLYRMDTWIPQYISEILPLDKRCRILDIGCGNGAFLYALKQRGYMDLTGIDMDEEAIRLAARNGINAICMDAMAYKTDRKYDLIYMSHVLEHLPKDSIIPFLLNIEENLLKSKGRLLIRVPNGQANTGCYWAYEDFTHNTLFTTGSLEYVLKSSGFWKLQFLDEDGTSEDSNFSKEIKRKLLYLYEKKLDFWNYVTGGAYHKASKRIYTWELKILAERGGVK